MPNVAIIGAGMAGLSALQELNRQGCQVTVFDKSRGSGGRLATKKVNDASWDMGAQFIKANTDSFAAQLAFWHQQGWIAPWDITPWKIRADEQSPSPDNSQRYVATPRMTALSRQLLKAAHQFNTETRITQCENKGQHWVLHDDQGRQYDGFDAVVVAIPPQQAATLLEKSNSPLAAHCHSAMLPCWTLLLALDTPVDTPWDAAFVEDSPIAWLSRNNSKPQRQPQEAWVIQANHRWSQQHCDSNRTLVQAELLKAFEALTGVTPDRITEHWLHRWLYAVPEQAQTSGYHLDSHQSLAVCGDWLKASSVEGAWLSGQEAAQALLERLSIHHHGAPA